MTTDITGKRFGRLLVQSAIREPGVRLRYQCVCDCGTSTVKFAKYILNGDTSSCGCAKIEGMRTRATKHGMCRKPQYNHWIGMKDRCSNPKHKDFHNYGGRGIRVCDEWVNSFEAFWADMGSTWVHGLTLEREDVNGDYEPGNCVWATWKEQANNTRKNILLPTPEGLMTPPEAELVFGISAANIRNRMTLGWASDRLLEPLQHQHYRRKTTHERMAD